jgi:hypothetical protein
MDDLNAQLSALLSDFVEQVTRLAREAAVSALGTALADGRSGEPAGRRSAPRVLTRPASSRSVATGTSTAELGPAIVAQLLAQPGQRMEQLRDRLGQPTPELQRAIKQLLSEELVRFEGLARGRTYFATDGATSASSKPATKRRGRRKS